MGQLPSAADPLPANSLPQTPTERPELPKPYTAATSLIGKPLGTGKPVLFFNLGFLEIQHSVEPAELEPWIPPGASITPDNVVVVNDNDIAMIHDMALYRQSRVKLAQTKRKK